MNTILFVGLLLAQNSFAQEEPRKDYIQELKVRVDISKFILENTKDSTNSNFTEVLKAAQLEEKENSGDLLELFFEKCKEINSDGSLSDFFKVTDGENLIVSDRKIRSHLKLLKDQLLDRAGRSIGLRLKLHLKLDMEIDESNNQVTFQLLREIDLSEAEEKIKLYTGIYFYDLYEFPEQGYSNHYRLLEGLNLDSLLRTVSQFQDGHLFVKEENRQEVERIIGEIRKSEFNILSDGIQFFWSSIVKEGPNGEEGYFYYPCRVSTDFINPVDVKNASIGLDDDDKALLSIAMTPEGQEKWYKMTVAKIGENVAMVLNERVVWTPRINEPIKYGQTHIYGDFTIEEARWFGPEINAGVPHAKCSIIELKAL